MDWTIEARALADEFGDQVLATSQMVVRQDRNDIFSELLFFGKDVPINPLLSLSMGSDSISGTETFVLDLAGLSQSVVYIHLDGNASAYSRYYSAVPLPGGALLLLSGIVGLASRRRLA